MNDQPLISLADSSLSNGPDEADTTFRRRPLLHALVSPGVGAGFGVEVDAVKCDKAAPFLSRCEAALRQRRVTTAVLPVPAVQCAPVEQVDNLPATLRNYALMVTGAIAAHRPQATVWRGEHLLQR